MIMRVPFYPLLSSDVSSLKDFNMKDAMILVKILIWRVVENVGEKIFYKKPAG